MNQAPKVEINMAEKIAYFEYMLDKLLEWQTIAAPSNSTPSKTLSKLSAIKLNFFASAAKASSTPSENGLLDIFDRFYAMPYGHVEMDIYERLSRLNTYTLNGNLLSKTTNNNRHIEDEITTKIDESIKYLQEINPNLINYDPFKLVELSHRWNSWAILYGIAELNNSKKIEIPISFIKEEEKYFKL
jgi:hypothetical protein